jgi:hypothetical protein
MADHVAHMGHQEENKSKKWRTCASAGVNELIKLRFSKGAPLRVCYLNMNFLKVIYTMYIKLISINKIIPIPPISTKRTITFHLKSLNTKRPWHMTEIQVLAWDRHKLWQELNRLMRSHYGIMLIISLSHVIKSQKLELPWKFRQRSKVKLSIRWINTWIVQHWIHAVFNPVYCWLIEQWGELQRWCNG